MIKFCTNCGGQVSDAAAFCVNCGAALKAGRPCAAPAPVGGSTGRGSPVVKILLICAGVLLLFGALGIAGLFYAGYRVKHKIEEVSKKYGIDTDKLSGSAPVARHVNPCSLLPQEEAAQILGVPIERTERNESPGASVCHYYGKPVSAEESSQQLSKAMEAVQQPKGQAAAGLDGVENLTKTILGGVTGGAAYFSVTVNWEDGRTDLAAMKLLTAAGGPEMKTSLPGIGDEALLGPMNSLLVFVKGATGVQIDLRMVPNGREKGIAMAKAIASRL